MTVTELAISRAGVATAVGLYTTCALASGAASAGGNCVRGGALEDRGAGAGRGRTTGRATTTSGRLRSGEALCCASAGTKHDGSNRDVRMVEASQDERRCAA